MSLEFDRREISIGDIDRESELESIHPSTSLSLERWAWVLVCVPSDTAERVDDDLIDLLHRQSSTCAHALAFGEVVDAAATRSE